ncbi:MAG: hypothetical protein ACREHD_19300 [Pirellulales bacterium]
MREVTAASAANRAGLKPGDVVEELDLQLASSLTLRRLNALLSTPGEHVLHVRRGDQSLRIVLQLQEALEDGPVKETTRKARQGR